MRNVRGVEMSEISCPHCGVNVSEHEAGRCLDAWVAEAVGWSDTTTNRHEPQVPHYSTDIAAAWEVVGRVAEKYYVDIGVYKRGAQVQINNYGDDGWEDWAGSIRADTAPLAICCAALKAGNGRPQA